jgi:hypothetical protein
MFNYFLKFLFIGAIFSSFTNAIADSNTNNPTLILNDKIEYFINANGVRVRNLPDVTKGKVLGNLGLNDKVKVINPTQIYNTNFVEVKIVLTYDQIDTSEKYFVSVSSLSEKIVDYKEFTSKYFVVVNVATETLRLYERQCLDNSCPHKLILESEVVVGEDVDHPKASPGKGRSILGSYRIVGWSKFYEDAHGHYPSWYKEGYPTVPSPDANWTAWFAKSVMPMDEQGKQEGTMRGAFGWYTAFVEPEPYGQWLHGTLGWGSDKDKYIKKVKTPIINIVSNPRSSGCTRNNNEAIAFLRNILEIGAPVIKIYSKEEIFDKELKRYPNLTNSWNYVLTKNKDHAIEKTQVLKNLNITDAELTSYLESVKAGGQIILDPKSPLNQILESGTYQYDSHPDVITYTPGEKMGKLARKIGRKGNVYGVEENEMHGKFYVDTGLLEDYAHPGKILETSGFEDEITPPWMKVRNLNE